MSSLSTNITFSPLDAQDFTYESKQVIDFIANYYKNIEKHSVLPTVEPGFLSTKLPNKAPYESESLEEILKDVNDIVVPGLTHWQSPNFFAYFAVNTSTAGFVGEMLCSAFNVIPFSWIASPAATELESIVTNWMGDMLKLPSEFLCSGTGGGVLQGSTCDAIVCVLAAARDQALKKLGGKYENIAKLVVYASDQTHCTAQKGAKLVGIPPSNFRIIETTKSTNFAIPPQKLRAAIEEDIKNGLTPLFLCGTIGTTSSGAVDPIEELGKISKEFDIWFHIDAAYAGAALICPEFRHYLNGVELADSITMNAHKWFLTPMDCCCMWIKQPNLLTDSLSIQPEYLRNNASESNSVIDYKDWQIALTRRFRAIKLWVVIRRYGLSNLMYHIRSDVNMAKRFETMVAGDSRFEIVVPTKFSLVCFRLKAKCESEGTNLNKKLLRDVNSSGDAYMTHAVIGGLYVIRCAIGTTLTQQHHIDNLWKLIRDKANYILCN
ncbi:hypothetical protein ACFE04_023392 [Oxalis oulophora]